VCVFWHYRLMVGVWVRELLDMVITCFFYVCMVGCMYVLVFEGAADE